MKITIVGTGYVGLVSGICFARIGHEVTCLDKDETKIKKLQNGEIPIFEPGLKEVLTEVKDAGKIKFTTSTKEAINTSEVIFIAVGTPSDKKTGHANLDFVFGVAKDIAQYANSYKVIVTKSTVPVGTGNKISEIIQAINANLEFNIVSNPEFLREGKALDDFLYPDRVVVGCDNNKSKEIMAQIYQPLVTLNNNKDLVLYSDVISSELIKYAANSFLATKVAFINEMANLCENVGGNIQDLSKAIGLDHRIGDKFLNPGPGFGGSCFPKDILALDHIAQENNVDLSIVKSVIKSNQDRKLAMAQRVIKFCDGDVKNKKIAILGLAFKGDTDDIRYSPAIVIVKNLLQNGAIIQAFDPEAMENSEIEIGQNSNISYHENEYEACREVDCLVIATEWQQFSKLDLEKVKKLSKKAKILDLRNMLNAQEAREIGFEYKSIG